MGPYAHARIGGVVHTGAGSEKAVHVVDRRLADQKAVGAGRKGLACLLLCSKRGDSVDHPLPKFTQIRGWFDHDSQPIVIVGAQVWRRGRNR